MNPGAQASTAAPAAVPALATGAVAVIMLAVMLRSFGGPDALAAVLLCAALVLAGSGYRRSPPRLRHTALLLFGITVLLFPFAKSPVAAIQRGMFVTGQLLAMIASVMLLSQCALRSTRIQALGTCLRAQPRQHRYLAFTLASQLFSGMLGMAGAHIMLSMAAPAGDTGSKHEKTDTVVAVTRGFAAAGFWSPVFGNMAIMLALYPSLHWIEIFPLGMLLAQVTLLIALAVARFRRRGKAATPAAAASPDAHSLHRKALPLLVPGLLFMGTLLSASRLLGIGITPTLVMLAPLVALAVHLAMGEPGRRLPRALHNLRESTRLFPALSSEALVFVPAGCAGSVMADAFPDAWVMQIGHLFAGTPPLGLGFLMLGVMSMALAGVHPVLSAVFLASTMTPEVLGVPPLPHMAAILTGWGLSAVLTPFSVLSLTASRYAGTSLYQVSFGRNWAFVLACLLPICLLLSAVSVAMR